MEERQSSARGILASVLAAFALAAILTCAAVFLVKDGGVPEAAIPWLVRGILAISSFAGGFLAAGGRRRRFLAGLFVGEILFTGICLAVRCMPDGEAWRPSESLPQVFCCLLPGMTGAIARGG